MANIFTVNQAPVNCSYGMYALVTTMLSAGWTQVGSGDSLTFSNSGTGSVIHGGTGIGGFGNTNSWVRLQMPQVTFASVPAKREILIQRGGTDLLWWIRYSCSASFIGTGNGAISATVTPTALDSVNMWGASSAGTTLFDVNGIQRFNAVAQNTGSYGFAFWGFDGGGAVVNGNARTVILLDPLQQASPSDPDPYILYADVGNTLILNTYQAGYGRFYVDQTANFLACYSTLTSSANYKNCNTAVYSPGFHADGQIGSDAFGTGLDSILPIFYGRRVNTTAPSGPKGFGTIMLYVPGRRSVGSLLSSTGIGANDKFCIADVCFPWNGAFAII